MTTRSVRAWPRSVAAASVAFAVLIAWAGWLAANPTTRSCADLPLYCTIRASDGAVLDAETGDVVSGWIRHSGLWITSSRGGPVAPSTDAEEHFCTMVFTMPTGGYGNDAAPRLVAVDRLPARSDDMRTFEGTWRVRADDVESRVELLRDGTIESAGASVGQWRAVRGFVWVTWPPHPPHVRCGTAQHAVRVLIPADDGDGLATTCEHVRASRVE